MKNKPKVLDEIARRDKEEQDMVKNKPSGIYVTDSNTQQSKELTIHELNQFILHKTEENKFLKQKIQELVNENNKLKLFIQSQKAVDRSPNNDISSENIFELSKNVIA